MAYIRDNEEAERKLSEQVSHCPPRPRGDPLFDHTADEHGLTLLNSEMDEIRRICREMDKADAEAEARRERNRRSLDR